MFKSIITCSVSFPHSQFFYNSMQWHSYKPVKSEVISLTDKKKCCNTHNSVIIMWDVLTVFC